MAWNQPDDRGSRPSRPSPPSALWQRRLRALWPGGAGRSAGPLAGLLLALLAIAWLLTGFYRVEAGERAGLLRLGTWVHELSPGTGWHLPWPIEDVAVVDASQLLDGGFQARLFTADASLVNATFSVQFTVRDARAALLGLREAGASARSAALAEARAAVGAHPLAELLGGSARVPLLAGLRVGLQRDLDRLGAGLAVQSVELVDLQVPEAVQPARRAVSEAGEERARRASAAEAAAAEALARTQAAAQKLHLDAEAYRAQVVGTAEGDAVRFELLLPAYEKNPQVLRDRLYIETMEQILTRSRKLFIDGKGPNTIYLPLERMFDASAVRGSGVAGVLDESALQAGGAPVPPAPTAAAAAAGAGGSAAASAPAATSAPGPQASSQGAAAPARGDRSREREVRR